jgi:lipopolysaccharide/colanic/teichoic acid biosynthesis glycosyltransferase
MNRIRVESIAVSAARDRPLADGSQHPVSFPRQPSRAGRAREQAGLAFKRATDLLLAIVLLALLAPVLLPIALAVRLDSPGPALFRQRRVGRRGREFSMLKFRSMAVDAPPDLHRRYIEQLFDEKPGPSDSALRKLTGDPRVTRIGAILRKTSIDELPQLLNVLVGQMSLVGPRPAVAYELEYYRPRHYERFAVRPGLTGLWQVSGRGRLGLQTMLDLDVEYVRNRSLMLDLRMLLRTPKAVLNAFTA